MYEVKRKAKITETLKFTDSDGKTLTLAVAINIDDILARYNIARRTLADAQAAVKAKQTDEALATLGKAVVAFLELLFGEDDTVSMLNFYEGRTTELLTDLAPFITDVITPRINDAMQERAAQYKRMKK